MIEENEKAINKGIEYLKKIGVEKIKEDTHLDTIKITDILEKRFDRLDYVRAKGFIYILEKEYHLDLSDWLEEYHAVYPQIDNEEQEKREIYSSKVRKKKITFYLCLVGVLVVIGIIAQIIFLGNSTIFNFKKELNAIESSAESLIQTPKPEISQSEVVTNDAPIQKDENLKKEASLKREESFKKEEEKKAPRDVITKPIYEIGNLVFDDLTFDPDNILYFEFVKPVWVGIVDLDSKKRIGRINKDFEITLDKELLIYIAYGTFIATLNDEEKNFNTYNPIFLIYTREGGLRQITKEEFVVLNGGIEW